MINNTYLNREHDRDGFGLNLSDDDYKTFGMARDKRTSVGRVVTAREMRERRVYGHEVVNQKLRSKSS